MEPLDVTPLRERPESIDDPDRRRVHLVRCAAQYAAEDERNVVINRLTDAGVTDADALVDRLIMAVRAADAHRLTYARGLVRDTDAWWPGIGDLNGAENFLHGTVRAYPVRTEEK